MSFVVNEFLQQGASVFNGYHVVYNVVQVRWNTCLFAFLYFTETSFTCLLVFFWPHGKSNLKLFLLSQCSARIIFFESLTSVRTQTLRWEPSSMYSIKVSMQGVMSDLFWQRPAAWLVLISMSSHTTLFSLRCKSTFLSALTQKKYCIHGLEEV